MHVRDGEAGGEGLEVGVLGGLVGAGLGGKLIELRGGHAGVDSGDDLLRDDDGIDVVGVQAVAELLNSGGDLVELDCGWVGGISVGIAMEGEG